MSDTDDTKDPKPEDTDKGNEPDKGKDLAAEAEKWKALARKHEAQAKANAEAAKKLEELENTGKTELQKLTDKMSEADKRAAAAEARALRLQVAYDKGLSPAQAKRLVGSTQEELESDADEFLESIKPSDDQGAPGNKPRENLKGGGAPAETPEEMDPHKLAAAIPRL